MKFNAETFFTVLIALVVFKVADKMFLDKALSNTFNWESESYED